MGFELISAIASIAALVVAGVEAHRQRRQKYIEDFTQYLSGLATSLRDIAASLRDRRIPTEAGNRLKHTLDDFTSFQEKLKLSKEQRKELLTAHTKLHHALTEAEFLDNVLRGGVINYPKKQFDETLHQMERLAAFIAHLSDTLKLTLR